MRFETAIAHKFETVVVRIDFPALADLVQYLKNRQQTELDALAAQVKELTAKLKRSSTELQGSVDTVEDQTKG